jgi:nucleotide-binding universal stress UspA family protein
MPGIIVGIDGSGHSRRALQWAVREAAIRHAPLTVLTVHQVVVGRWGRAVVYLEDYPLAECNRRAAEQEVDDVLAGLGESGPESVMVKAVSGGPVEELIEASRTADLLVLGSRGAGGFARLLMGSIATQVAHHAYCPIVIIPPPTASASGDRSRREKTKDIYAERRVVCAPRLRHRPTWHAADRPSGRPIRHARHLVRLPPPHSLLPEVPARLLQNR